MFDDLEDYPAHYNQAAKVLEDFHIYLSELGLKMRPSLTDMSEARIRSGEVG